MKKWITTWLAGNVLRILWKINWRFSNTAELCRRSVIWQQPIRTLPSLTETLYAFASRAHNRLKNWSDLLQTFKITLRGHPSYIFRCKTLSTFVTMHATPWYNVSAISCSHFVHFDGNFNWLYLFCFTFAKVLDLPCSIPSPCWLRKA